MLNFHEHVKGDIIDGKTGNQPEQLICKLREVKILLSTDQSVQTAVRQFGVTEQTYYRWRKEYGGMKVEQAKRLKEAEKENAWLRKLVADLFLNIRNFFVIAKGSVA
jgi:putative transposase